MKIDLYTKIVLTVIAVCLSIIACRTTSSTKPAHAISEDAVKVVIAGVSPNLTIPVRLKSIDYFLENSGIPVRVK